jgi:hypothetical protein
MARFEAGENDKMMEILEKLARVVTVEKDKIVEMLEKGSTFMMLEMVLADLRFQLPPPGRGTRRDTWGPSRTAFDRMCFLRSGPRAPDWRPAWQGGSVLVVRSRERL